MKTGSGTLVPPNLSKSNCEAEASLPKNHSHLPHLDLQDQYQFVTFRTFDSVDDYVKKIFSSDVENKEKQLKIDEYLDKSSKGDHLQGKVLEYLRGFLLEKDKTIIDIVSFAIMPNHVHLLIKPNAPLPQIMQNIKGGSAFYINKILNKGNKFWLTDYYDKVIKDDKHFCIVYEYIKNNPIKANLKDFKKRFYGIYK